MMTNQFPIIGIIGKRGDGKTVTMRALAESYSQDMNVFANFTMHDIDYTHIEFDDILEFPEYLHDGVIFIDEAHVGVDSYKVFSKRTKGITDFTTQTRKRRLIFIYSTQVFTQVAKRLRNLTDYLLYTKSIDTEGSFLWRTYDIDSDIPIVQKIVDLTMFFDKYDTNELITIEDEE